MAQYGSHLTAAEIERLVSQLRSHVPEWDDFPVKNHEDVPTLFFDESTPTGKLARLAALAVERMRKLCGRRHGIRGTKAEVGMFSFCIEVIRSQDYLRADGTMGARDLATNLPTAIGSPGHPLKPSLAAHKRHEEAYSFSGDSAKGADELWSVNRFRGEHRTSGLLAVLDIMRPALQDFRDKLAERGVSASKRPLGKPSPRLVALWSQNKTSVEERVLTDAGYLPGLEQAWQRRLEEISMSQPEGSMPPSEGPAGNSCLHCSNKPARRGLNARLCQSCGFIKVELDLAREVQAELEQAKGAPSSPPSVDRGITPLPRHHSSSGCEQHSAGAGRPSGRPDEGDPAPVQSVAFQRQCALCRLSFPHDGIWRSIPGPLFVSCYLIAS